jgi:uncharacterized phage infection (PIP) family protein YhgE
MSQYTTPITTAFEVQRAAIESSQRAFTQSVEFSRSVNEAFLDSLESGQSAGRRGVELNEALVHSYLDAVAATVPGAGPTVEELRSAVDEQFDLVLDNREEVFETVTAEFEEGLGAYDELTEELVEAAEEQLDLFVAAHEDLEAQSVEAVEEWSAGVESLQEQVEEVQEQVREVQEQAAQAVEA